MKRSRYTEEQIIGILKEQEAGTPVAEEDVRAFINVCCIRQLLRSHVI
jgi:hypothetical protein